MCSEIILLSYSYTYNGVSLHKWVTIAKQSLSELNMSANFEYQPIWSDNMRSCGSQLVKRIITAKITAEKNIEEFNKTLHQRHKGAVLKIVL